MYDIKLLFRNTHLIVLSILSFTLLTQLRPIMSVVSSGSYRWKRIAETQNAPTDDEGQGLRVPMWKTLLLVGRGSVSDLNSVSLLNLARCSVLCLSVCELFFVTFIYVQKYQIQNRKQSIWDILTPMPEKTLVWCCCQQPITSFLDSNLFL